MESQEVISRLGAELKKRLKNTRDWLGGKGMKYKGPGYYKARGKEAAYDAILNIIDSLQYEQPDVPEGLDEAAKNYALNTAEDSEQYSARYLGYKDGAKWQKEQMLKDAMEAMVTTNLANRPVIYLDQLKGFQYGDKVRLIVLKAEEE